MTTETPTMSTPPKINVVDRRFWAKDSRAQDDGDTPKKPTYVEALETQLKEREAKLDDTLTKHRLAVNEFEESRVRLSRDVAKEVDRQKRQMLVELLEVLDNLDRAVAAAEKATEIATLRQGVAMVRDQFVAKLQSLGVKRRQSLGEPFDPRWHDAMTHVPVTDPSQADRVVGVIQEAYEIQGEPLRPAQVAVGKGQEPDADDA
ncbi:MAG: nucleotide exchange factor GrpE [Deltaproteobacteria bacterium]|nr:nucleotide exchange factor GrpE [Deltaproteobacteria bacterium]